MLQFWFLWLFIAIVVVIVAFTLRKERDDVPRKDILRAVETRQEAWASQRSHSSGPFRG